MGAHAVVELAVPAFAEQVFVDLAQHRREAVGILDVPSERPGAHVQGVGEAFGAAGDDAGEEAFGIDAFERDEIRRTARVADRDLGGLRGEDRDADRLAVATVHPEHAERVAVPAADDRLDVGGGSTFPGLGRYGHQVSLFKSSRTPRRGMRTHAGRLPIS